MDLDMNLCMGPNVVMIFPLAPTSEPRPRSQGPLINFMDQQNKFRGFRAQQAKNHVNRGQSQICAPNWAHNKNNFGPNGGTNNNFGLGFQTRSKYK